jgi:hypothetical protein
MADGARNRAEKPFAAESRSLVALLASGHRHICFSRPGPDDAEGPDYQTRGRLSASVLAAMDLPRGAETYLRVHGGRLGCPARRRHRPCPHPDLRRRTRADPGYRGRCGPATAPAPGAPADGPKVVFARSGLTVPWAAGYASLLELAEACDVPVRWSCRTGVCYTCETNLMSGAVSYAPDPGR